MLIDNRLLDLLRVRVSGRLTTQIRCLHRQRRICADFPWSDALRRDSSRAPSRTQWTQDFVNWSWYGFHSTYPIFIAITVHWVLSGRRRSSICRNGLNMFFWRRHKRKLPNRYALRGREMISTDHSKVEQPMAKTLARHPLVLLDQQLKNLAKYEVLTKADQPQNNPTQVEMSLPP